MTRSCFQINLHREFGGGEIYTAFVARALEGLGRPSTVFVSRRAGFWAEILPTKTSVISVDSYDDIFRRLPSADASILFHTPAFDVAQTLRGNHRVASFIHMPPYGRNTGGLEAFDLLLPVSDYVRQGLIAARLANVHTRPMYGVASLDRGLVDHPIRRGPLFAWDRRKVRDRLLEITEPVWGSFVPRPRYVKPDDSAIVFGIVSRITTIKQFPLLFTKLMPILMRQPRIRFEIFGSGGFASMRDLWRALRPLGSRVRYWGQQKNVSAVYRGLDYVLTGLPELEALGLNVVEAQACGTPVIGVSAPPFTETILDGRTGFLYRDPREDDGKAFAELLDRILRVPRPDPRLATEHMARFSERTFGARLEQALNVLENRDAHGPG